MSSQRVTRNSALNQSIQLTPMQENIGKRRKRDESEEEPNERAPVKQKTTTSIKKKAFKVNNGNIRDYIIKYFKQPGTLPPIGEWDVSSVTNMKNLFNADFNKLNFQINIYNFNEDISNWNVSNVNDMSKMFYNTSFNQDINKWNVSKVANMTGMFLKNKRFNQPLNNWNVSNVKYMKNMFGFAIKFNQPLNNWNVSNVEYYDYMFANASSFDQPLNSWNVSSAKSMRYMFLKALKFNQSLNNWNVSNVETMEGLFAEATTFNQPLDQWNVSNVEDMTNMFNEATSFNQSLNTWNVSNVTYFAAMFSNAGSFNQPLNNWNVRRAINMTEMFEDTRSFDQNISNWEIQTTTTMINNMFLNSGIREEFKPRITIQQPVNIPIPPPQPTEEGIAHQVHIAFSVINFNDFFNLINNGKLDNYSSSQNFNQYMKNELKNILNNYNEPDKNSLEYKFNRLTEKINQISYKYTDFNMNPNPPGIDAFYTIMNFVKKQDKHYQDNYIKFFINDSYSAYDSGDTTSCVKGIKERIIFSVGQAGYDIDNPLYKELSEALFPIRDSQIYSFIKNCIINNKTTLIKIPDENFEEKKNIVRECVKKRISESFPTLSVNMMDGRINGLIDNVSDMLLNDYLSGGKRRTKKNNKKYKKKYTKKQIRRRHKNFSRKR